MVHVIKGSHSLGSWCNVLGFESESACYAQGTNIEACPIINQRQGNMESLVLHRGEQGLIMVYPR